MFSISARSLFELSNVASAISSNASAFAKLPNRANRKDLLNVVQELQDLVICISGEAFEGVANEELKANREEVKQVLAEAAAEAAVRNLCFLPSSEVLRGLSYECEAPRYYYFLAFFEALPFFGCWASGSGSWVSSSSSSPSSS